MKMLMKRGAVGAAILLFGCSADAVGTPDESRVIGSIHGMDVVESETLPFTEVEERTQAVTTEPFYGTDEWGWGVAPYRVNNCYFRASASHATPFGNGYGEAGEGSSSFDIKNRWAPGVTLQNQPASGAVQWWIHFPAGSPCNNFQCTFYICLSAGTAWPRCVSSHDPRGATNEFHDDPWPQAQTKTFTMYYQAWQGGGFPTTTLGQPNSDNSGGEDMFIFHTCL